MTALEKHLGRFAQECRRQDADRWQLALSNGHALSVDGGWAADGSWPGLRLSKR